jgi:hypothetical protein
VYAKELERDFRSIAQPQLAAHSFDWVVVGQLRLNGNF